MFHRKALDEVTQTSRAAALERHLTSLVRRDVICPDRARFPGDEAFRFRHVLIRDAAYRSLPLDRRAQLHARFAGVAGANRRVASERVRGDRRLPPRAQLSLARGAGPGRRGRPGARRPRGGSPRVRGPQGSGSRRPHRCDPGQPLERAAALLTHDPLRAARLLPDLGAALIEAGRLSDARRILANATREAAAAGDESATAHVLVHEQFRRLAARQDREHRGCGGSRRPGHPDLRARREPAWAM